MMRTMDEVLTADFRTAPTPQEVGKWKVECDQLRAENARLAAELAEARMFLLKIHTDIYGDDYGDLMCEFDDDFLKEIEQFLGKTAVKDGE